MSDHERDPGEPRGFTPPGAPPPPPGSDRAPAPGWWLASDGNWYPPQDQQPAPPPPPTQAFGNEWAPPPVGQPPTGPQTRPSEGPSAAPGSGWAPPPPGAGYGQYAAPDGGVYYSPHLAHEQSNGLATWSLVLGIISILAFWAFGLGVLLGILAVIFGVIGRNRARELPGTPHEGRAKAGLVLGVVGIVGGVLFVGWALTFVDDVVDEMERQLDDGVCEADNPFDPDC